MGGATSKSESTLFVEAINKAFMSNIQQCSATSDISQTINISGSNNIISGIVMDQVYKDMLKCTQDVSFVTNFQNQLVAAIKQSAESSSVALLGALGNSDSEVSTHIHQSVTNIINMQSLSQLVSKMRAEQSINISGNSNVLKDISMSQYTENFLTNVQTLTNQISVVNDIKNQIDQKTSAKQQDPILNLLNGLSNLISGPIMWMVILIGIVVLGFVWFMNSAGGQQITSSATKMASARMGMPPPSYGMPPPSYGMPPPPMRYAYPMTR